MNAGQSSADWIAVDWGTTRLRAWAMTGAGDMRAEAVSDEGMGGLARDACGMVGSRQGWAEAPYVAVPARPSDLPPMPVATRDARIRMSILPGLSQARPPDVMRGEETQAAGFLALNPGFDGILCLPGTHTKWVQLSAGEVTGFQSFMTGELFQLLSERSVLRHSVAAAEIDSAAFGAAVSDALSEPERLAQRLFSIRAENVLAGLPPEAGRARLSGLLIGAELAGARPFWLGQDVAVAGAPALARLYADALGAQGVPVRTQDADPLTRLGLARAWQTLRETAG
jgi:2-dehydro-3-deoxygalactonokinase